MKPLKLSDAIENIREEFEAAQRKSEDKKLRFNVTSIEVELEVIAEEETDASAGFNWYVLRGDIASREKSIATHRLKVYLQPIDNKGASIKIADKVDERPK